MTLTFGVNNSFPRFVEVSTNLWREKLVVRARQTVTHQSFN